MKGFKITIKHMLQYLKNNIIVILAIMVLLSSLIYYLYFYQYLLRNYHRYTYAIVEKKKGGVGVDLFYKVNDTIHWTQLKGCNECIVKKSRFLVKFCINFPSIHRIYKEYPIPDTIGSPPIDGWEKVPWKLE